VVLFLLSLCFFRVFPPPPLSRVFGLRCVYSLPSCRGCRLFSRLGPLPCRIFFFFPQFVAPPPFPGPGAPFSALEVFRFFLIPIPVSCPQPVRLFPRLALTRRLSRSNSAKSSPLHPFCSFLRAPPRFLPDLVGQTFDTASPSCLPRLQEFPLGVPSKPPGLASPFLFFL